MNGTKRALIKDQPRLSAAVLEKLTGNLDCGKKLYCMFQFLYMDCFLKISQGADLCNEFWGNLD